MESLRVSLNRQIEEQVASRQREFENSLRSDVEELSRQREALAASQNLFKGQINKAEEEKNRFADLTRERDEKDKQLAAISGELEATNEKLHILQRDRPDSLREEMLVRSKKMEL